jgi:hypothetical protein
MLLPVDDPEESMRLALGTLETMQFSQSWRSPTVVATIAPKPCWLSVLFAS